MRGAGSPPKLLQAGLDEGGDVGVVAEAQDGLFDQLILEGVLPAEVTIQRNGNTALLVIADAKRGDIGSTFAAYADAWLSPGSPLEAASGRPVAPITCPSASVWVSSSTPSR